MLRAVAACYGPTSPRIPVSTSQCPYARTPWTKRALRLGYCWWVITAIISPIRARREGPNACTSLSVVSLGCLLGPEAVWAISLTTSDSSSLLRGKRQLSIRSPKSPPAVNRTAIPIDDRRSRGVMYQTSDHQVRMMPAMLQFTTRSSSPANEPRTASPLGFLPGHASPAQSPHNSVRG
jgi:hypothetical protein